MQLAVIGDYDSAKPTHRFTDDALARSSDGPPAEWTATDDLGAGYEKRLSHFAGLLIAPGSPYRDMDGALRAIRFARERGVPLFGT